MAKTVITAVLAMETTSLSRIGDFMDDLATLMGQHKVRPISNTIYQGDGYVERTGSGLGRGSAEDGAARDASASRDAHGDGPAAGPGEATGDPADAPKRGRGRPRKSDAGDGSAEAGSGSAEGGRRRSRRDGEGSAEAAGGNEPAGSAEGSEPASGEGEGRARGAGRSGEGAGRSGSQARISSGEDRGEADDWDDAAPSTAKVSAKSEEKSKEKGEDHWVKVPDEKDGDITVFKWPDHLMPNGNIDTGLLGTLLADHHEATGGTDREPTFNILQAATGVRSIKQVDERDFENLAAGLLKDAAKYRLGIKRPK